MKKIRLSACLCFLATFCLIFTGCSFSESSDGDGKTTSSFAYFINDVKVVSVGDGEETGNYSFEMLQRLTNIIYDNIDDEYGNELIEFKTREFDDTHKNAIEQDDWNWKFDDAPKKDILSFMQYQFSKILLGQNTLDLTPSDFSKTEYLELEQNGEFEEENLRALANRLAHVGFFSYELDNLAEFVLNEIIGTDVVERDHLKFLDANANKTFDFVEEYSLLGLDYYHNIILSYDSTYQKDESKSKNGVWDRIKWGTSLETPKIFDDIVEDGQDVPQGDIIKATEIVTERPLSLDEIEIAVDIYANAIATDPTQKEQEIQKFKQQNNVSKFSGFKNYTNITYYWFYSAMKNFTFLHEGETLPVVIEDVLEMTHVPNTKTRICQPLSLPYDTDNQKFNLPYDAYKSVLITSNMLCATSSFFIAIQSNLPNQDLQVDIKVRYQFTSDAYRSYIGSYEGESRLIEGKMMSMKIPPGEGSSYYALLTITPENIQGLIDRGVNVTEEDITPLARVGVNNVVLSKYVPYVYDKDEKHDFFHYKEGYIANPSTTFQGSSFHYINERSDFLEIVFDVKGTYDVEPKFAFAINWM